MSSDKQIKQLRIGEDDLAKTGGKLCLPFNYRHYSAGSAESSKRIRVSQCVTQGMVLNKVQPVYPPLARTARVQGSVVLAAVIGKDDTIQNLHVISPTRC